MGMNELFQIDPVKSPRMRWMERHYLTTQNTVDEHGHLLMSVYHGMAKIATGETLDAALVAAAKSLNIRLWNEESLVNTGVLTTAGGGMGRAESVSTGGLTGEAAASGQHLTNPQA